MGKEGYRLVSTVSGDLHACLLGSNFQITFYKHSESRINYAAFHERLTCNWPSCYFLHISYVVDLNPLSSKLGFISYMSAKIKSNFSKDKKHHIRDKINKESCAGFDYLTNHG